ncbi:MAG: hypothetical protein LBT14_00235 [Treponema sp.]|nr:hypothetical protein [Treponema sp.]
MLGATNDREVNHRISRECQEQGIPVSVADYQEEASFFFPGVVVSDQIILGVSSGRSDRRR